MKEAIGRSAANNALRQKRLDTARGGLQRGNAGRVLFDLFTTGKQRELTQERAGFEPQLAELETQRSNTMAQAIQNATPEQQAAFATLPRAKQEEIFSTRFNQKPTERRVIKDAQGINRFVDTQEQVFQGATPEPKDRKTAKDSAGVLRNIDDGSRVFPDASGGVTRRKSKDGKIDLLFEGNAPLNEGLEKGLQWGEDKEGNRVAVPIPTQQNDKAKGLKTQTLNIVNRLVKNVDGVNSIFGALDNITPNFVGTTREAQTDMNQLINILTSENLDIMSGVLSETDIKIIAGIAGGQFASTNTQEGARSALIELQGTLKAADAGKKKAADASTLKAKYGLE